MRTIKVNLTKPLNIDVSQIAKHFPEFRYRGPFNGTFGEVTSELICNDLDADRRYFLYFYDKTECGFTFVESNYPPSELACLFTKLPSLLSEHLKEALKGTSLEIPEVNPKLLADLEAIRIAQSKNEQKIAALLAKQPIIKNGDFTSKNAKLVSQHEVAITSGEHSYPVIGTFGAGPCIIIAFYNPELATAGLAHIDSLTNISSLSQYLDLVKGNTASKLEVHIYGGNQLTKYLIIQLLDFLEERDDITVISSRVMASKTYLESLAIDSRTGDVYTNFSPKQLDSGDNLDMRMALVGLLLFETDLTLIMIEPNNSPKICRLRP